ncbi:MAG: hypothetical protein FWF81_01910 [Defluviitaleaceae bacterium]|nr:hypothetical protein [Defluviitaleaceae bacterium]
MNKSRTLKIGMAMVFSLMFAAVVYLIAANVQTTAIAAQPGDADDPLVTRRYVDERIAQLSEEVATLRGILAGIAPGAVPGTSPATTPTPGTAPNLSNIPQSERDILFADMMLYFETMYGERLAQALEQIPGPGGPEFMPQRAYFTVLNPQAGQTITFDGGTEFILRGGAATAMAGVNGIPNVTSGTDIQNGENIGLNHLHMVPATDGRGVLFSRESWIMIRGGHRIDGYTIVY